MFLEGEEVETYGRLVTLEGDDDAMMKMMSRLQYYPGEGLLILEIQQRILRFLVECCEGILHDHSSAALIRDFPANPEPPALADSSEWPALASIASEAPYRLPARLNFNRIITVFEAQRATAEDHIRSLREDPGYFADVVGDWSEHRQEILLDADGERHPILAKPLFWQRVIGSVVTEAYGALIAWSINGEQLVALSALQENNSNIISPQQRLPPGYVKALLTLRYTLDQTKKSLIHNLKIGVPSSPPLRSQFVREPAVFGSNMIYVRTKGGQDGLMWLFSSLWNDQQLEFLGFPSLMDEIEKLTQMNAKEIAKLPSWVAQMFADLGVMARVQHELDLYQPWAAGFEYEYTTYGTEIEKDFPILFAALGELTNNVRGIAFFKIWAPMEGRFYYPSDNVEQTNHGEYA